MSPKIVNGSFAAIYDTADVFNDCMKTFGQLRLEPRDSPGKCIRKINNMRFQIYFNYLLFLLISILNNKNK